MTRHLKIGVLVALVVASIITATALMNENAQPGIFGMILAGPALPVVYVLCQIYPPPMGESEISPWDYLMLTVAVLVASSFWGFIAGLLSKYVFRRRQNAA
jgi:hypothetical protein